MPGEMCKSDGKESRPLLRIGFPRRNLNVAMAMPVGYAEKTTPALMQEHSVA
jgi:hypothetical protein